MYNYPLTSLTFEKKSLKFCHLTLPGTVKYYFQNYFNMLEVPYNVINIILPCKFLGSIGSSLVEQAESIFRAYTGDSVADDLYLIVHNVDGPMLRNEVSQGILSR